MVMLSPSSIGHAVADVISLGMYAFEPALREQKEQREKTFEKQQCVHISLSLLIHN